MEMKNKGLLTVRLKKVLKCITYLILLPSLCGCSLAVPDAGVEGGSDRMIGVFITDEFLDLFDIERYLNDHASGFVDGQEVEIPYDSGYEGKLYAKIDKSKGSDPADWEVSFENLEGISMFTPYWTMENEESYWGSVCTEGIYADIRYYESEDSVEHNISGTVYILSEKENENKVYYANPVYQTQDGKIYVTRGSGVSTSGESAEGVKMSSTFSGETTTTENGKTKTEKSNVSVEYAVMYRPVRVTVCQMDLEHRIIQKEDYLPEEMPEELTAKKDTEYILVEMEKEGANGEKTVSREVYDHDPDGGVWLVTYCARDDGIVVRQETKVLWSK